MKILYCYRYMKRGEGEGEKGRMERGREGSQEGGREGGREPEGEFVFIYT